MILVVHRQERSTTLTSPREPDLAEWAASRVSDAFRQVFGKGLAVSYERS